MTEVIIWLVCGGLGYGLWDGNWSDRKATNDESIGCMLLCLIFGPIAGGAGIGEAIRKALPK